MLAGQAGIVARLANTAATIVVLHHAVAKQGNNIFDSKMHSAIAGIAGQGIAASLAGVIAGIADSVTAIVVSIDTPTVRNS